MGKVALLEKVVAVKRRVGWRGLAQRIIEVLLTRAGISGFETWRRIAPNDRTYLTWIDFFERSGRLPYKVLLRFWPKPLFSIVLPVYNTPERWLRAAIESVLSQEYTNWELCIGDDASTLPHVRTLLEEYAAQDSRIKVIYRSENGHISAASNSALTLVTGRFIVLFDHDDVLAPDALYWVAREIRACQGCALIYSDEDKIGPDGLRCGPYFKPDWNPDLFLSQNLVSHLGVFDAKLVREVGGFREGFDGSQDHELALRIVEKITPDRIRHIPRVLYHWRIHPGSAALNQDQKPYTTAAGIRAVSEHLARKSIDAMVTEADEARGMYRVRYGLRGAPPRVVIIIPTRDRVDLLRPCIQSILEKTTYPDYRILIVDNGSVDADALSYLKEIEMNEKVSVLRDERPFNFAALNNHAVSTVEEEVVGLLNNDLEVINHDWLDEMVSHALRPEIGIVGARLWYPNNTLQHAGIFLAGERIALHAYKGLSRGDVGYAARAVLTQNYSAVTGACMVFRKAVFQQVGGMDECLAVSYNDVDLCLRVKSAGYRNLWTPYAEFYHHESATRSEEDTPQKRLRLEHESNIMRGRWDTLLYSDPAYNPNLAVDQEDFSLAWPPRR